MGGPALQPARRRRQSGELAHGSVLRGQRRAPPISRCRRSTRPSCSGATRRWPTSPPGKSVTLGKGLGTLGYEWDIDSDNGFRPAGEIDLSSTTENANAPDQVFDDYGTNVVPATVTHHLSLYKAASGAYVFGAGTVQFAYGLASSNPAGAPPDPNMEQFTVNLFALMGAQPATLTSGPGARLALHRHRAAHLDDHLARSQRHAHRRRPGHHHRNRDRHQRRGGGRRRGLDRRRQHLAPGDGHPWRVHDLVLQLAGRARQPDRDH